MKIGKAKYYSDVTDEDWELFAKDLEISPKLVKSELERQKKLLPDIIKQLANKLNCEIGYQILNYVKSKI